MYEGSDFSTSSPIFVIVHLTDYNHPNVCEMVLLVSNYTSLMTNDADDLFMCIFAIYRSYLQNCLCKFFAYFYVEL